MLPDKLCKHCGKGGKYTCDCLVTGQPDNSIDARIEWSKEHSTRQPDDLSVSDIQNAIQGAQPERIIVRQELRQRDGQPIEVLHEKIEYKVTAWNQAVAVMAVIKPYLRQPKREISREELAALSRVVTAIGKLKMGSIEGMATSDFHSVQAAVSRIDEQGWRGPGSRWIYLFKQMIKWDGKEQYMLTIAESPKAKLTDATLIGRIAVTDIEGGHT